MYVRWICILYIYIYIFLYDPRVYLSMSIHTISYGIRLYCIRLDYIVLYYVVSFRLNYSIVYYVILYYGLIYSIIPYYTLSCIILYHSILSCIILCYVIVYQIIVNYSMLYCIYLSIYLSIYLFASVYHYNVLVYSISICRLYESTPLFHLCVQANGGCHIQSCRVSHSQVRLPPHWVAWHLTGIGKRKDNVPGIFTQETNSLLWKMVHL